MDGPVISSDDRSKGWLLFAGGLVLTIAAVVGVINLWPEGDDEVAATDTAAETTRDEATDAGDDEEPGGSDTTAATTGEPSDRSTTSTPTTAPGPVNLFIGGADGAVRDLVAAAGGATQAIEITIYDTYAFLAYRDPANPGNIDRRIWREGVVGDPDPNPIDDRVDADTEPGLFGLAEVDLSILPRLTADAPSHYDMPVNVTHVIIDRFLPFDERVLIRVYATPADGRSGGGYISYDTAGNHVNTCC
jgi:hypothetical protein